MKKSLIGVVFVVLVGLAGSRVGAKDEAPAPAPTAPTSWPMTATEDTAIRSLEAEAQKLAEAQKAIQAKFLAILSEVKERLVAKGFPKTGEVDLFGRNEKVPGVWGVRAPAKVQESQSKP